MRAQIKAGFSLVEVLVSLLILSLGIIGAASMQLTALRNIQQSGFHSAALRIATDIAEQIRALPPSGIGDSGNPLIGMDFKPKMSMPADPESCFGIHSICSLTMLHASQIHEIESRLQLVLPQGRIKICRDTSPWDSASNAYTWECESSVGNAPIVVKIGWREPAEWLSMASGTTSAPRLVILVQA